MGTPDTLQPTKTTWSTDTPRREDNDASNDAEPTSKAEDLDRSVENDLVEQLRCLQEKYEELETAASIQKEERKKYEELETAASIAKEEHQNTQKQFQDELAAATQNEQEACEKIKALQVELQEQLAVADQQKLERAARIELLEREVHELVSERNEEAQKHLDAKRSLESELDLARENGLSAQQQMAMHEKQLQDHTAAANARELEGREQIMSVQSLLASREEELALLRASTQTTQDELARQLAAADDSQRQGSAANEGC